MKPPFNLALVEADTVIAMEDGHKILCTHKFGDDEQDHAAHIADALFPTPGKHVVDVGCGVGEMARLLSAFDEELHFTLVNISPFQLALCPIGERFAHVQGDWHDLQLPPASADGVVFASALCQLDIELALKKAHEVLRPGGVLVVSDMHRVRGEPDDMERAMAARVLHIGEIGRLVTGAGFTLEFMEQPPYDDSHFRKMLAGAGIEHLLDEVRPLLVRAVK